ncbi:MAG: hypothetical protein VR64_14775 [Desulfatitalea sp. BRH_c12]|nr:MAG: hypothetical protein VR64_14775 [Desulfatitalea sp. BRH_c12]
MIKKKIGLALGVLLCSAAFVFAADQDQNRTRQQKRVKDGSGQITQPIMEQNELAGDTARDRDRRRDGSCDITQATTSGLLAADTTRNRDRKRDGSCKNRLSDPDGPLLAADKTRDRDRKRDGSCQG